MADFSKAVQLDPNYAPAYTNRALALRQTNRNDQALADFSRAIQADPNYGPAYIGRANLLRAQNQYQEALSDLNMATRLLPESAEALHSRGLLYQRQGMHPQAILDFDATIDRNPFVGAPYAARGQSFVATQPVRQGHRGLQRSPQRQCQGCQFLGLARRRLRAQGRPAAGDRELPARARHRQRQQRRPPGLVPPPGRRPVPLLRA